MMMCMKRLILLSFLLVTGVVSGTPIYTAGTWTPIFKGVDLASGVQTPVLSGEHLLHLECLRIDLTDPDVQLLTTPHCTNNCGNETLSENTSLFLETNHLQAAINCNFYGGSGGPTDSAIGTPEDV